MFVRTLLLLPALLAALVSPLVAQDQMMFLRLRDGSVILAELQEASLPWVEIAVDGSASIEPLPVASLRRLDLVPNPITRRLDEVRNWIRDLGGDDYAAREAAQLQLLDRGAEFLELLQAQSDVGDPEVRWRVKVILEAIGRRSESSRRLEFDRVVLEAEADPRWLERRRPDGSLAGNLGEFELPIRYAGAELKLTRDRIASIWRPGADEQPVERRQGERITVDRLDRFPSGSYRLDFASTPDLQSPPEGTKLDEAYRAFGVRISTSLVGGSVTTFDYTVTGAPSGKPSAGGRAASENESNFEGITTFRFHLPGRADIPATISTFGCYLSRVEKGQTKVRFYDTQGGLIEELETTKSPWDFVGFASARPIARVEIHPTSSDRNYAFDDVQFDPPTLQGDAASQETVSVALRDGQVLRAAGMEVTEGGLLLTELTIGLARIEIPADQVRLLVPKSDPFDPAAAPPRLWTRTRMGDRMMITADASGAHPLRAPDLALGIDQLQALWRSTQPDIEMALAVAHEEPGWLDADGDFQVLRRAAFAADGIEGTSPDPAWKEVSTYDRLPPILLAPPVTASDETPMLRTIDGELWVIDGRRLAYRGLSPDGIVLAFGDRELLFPYGQVAVLRLGAETIR